MKSNNKIRKVLKQLKHCQEIEKIERTKNGFRVYAKNGEVRAVHMGNAAWLPLKVWLRRNTSLKNLSV